MQERRERDIAERREQQERELDYWKLRQEREIALAKEQEKQQERALKEKQRQLEEEDLLSKKFVPLGHTKPKRSVNEEVRSDEPGSKPVRTRDEMGIWRRASTVFDSPVKRNKVELCRDERMLNVDGLFRKGDEQLNELTDAQIMQ